MALTQIKTTGIANEAVTNAKLGPDCVDSSKIADDAVVAEGIADDAIVTAAIADDAIAHNHMADSSINAAAIADDSVTAAKTDLSIVQGDIIYGTGADAWARLAKGTAEQVLTMNSGATAPEWATASGGTFSKAIHDTGSTQTVVNKDNDSPAVRVGGTGLELEITPPSSTTSYLILIRTAVHANDNDGQWGMKLCYSTDDWSSQSNLTFMHNSFGYETTTKTRYNINTWKEWKPGSTSTYKVGLFAEVWSTDSIELTFNGHGGVSSLTALEISDATKKVGDWG